LTGKALVDNLNPVNREVSLSSKKSKEALDGFQLFYEEIINIKPQSRIRRVRQQSSANA